MALFVLESLCKIPNVLSRSCPRLLNNCVALLQCRNSVSDINSDGSDGNDRRQNIEELFTAKEVQQILKALTKLDIEKVFRNRLEPSRKPFYCTMSENQLKRVMNIAYKKAKKRIQMPPVMKPWTNEPIVYSQDPELEGLETSKIVYVDVRANISDRDRLTVVRETNGTLQRPSREDHFRYCQIFVPRPCRKLYVPPMFSGEYLKNVLNSGQYQFILDRACVQFEPDDPKYIEVCVQTYEHLNKDGKFETLRSTRHFGGMVFYFVMQKNVDNLLLHFIQRNLLQDALLLIRLYHVIHPTSASASLEIEDELELIKMFANHECKKAGHIQLAAQVFQQTDLKAQIS